jgi:hypothetical protein
VAADAEDVRIAAYLRLAGEPARALARMRPIAAWLDEVGLLELARVEVANGHVFDARSGRLRAEKGSGEQADVRMTGSI